MPSSAELKQTGQTQDDIIEHAACCEMTGLLLQALIAQEVSEQDAQKYQSGASIGWSAAFVYLRTGHLPAWLLQDPEDVPITIV